MILRECDTCQRRTDHDRRQWAEDAVIYTEYTCTQCGTVDTHFQDYEATDEQQI